jgi:hypothetical protein
MDHPNATVEQVVFLIKHVLEKWSGLPDQLDHLMDSKGREAISICIPEGRVLMNAYLLFLGHYDLQSGSPIHKSATVIVRWQVAYLLLTQYLIYHWHYLIYYYCRYAMDHSVEPPVRVALKFMKYRDQFDREVIAADMLY